MRAERSSAKHGGSTQHPDIVAKLKAVMTQTRTELPAFPLTKRQALY
ncbi:hypothetical protein ACFQ4C_07840 [Larkinella insperata]|uniref:Uncharacterized protein n=1 Tax=Larkinella insperata TaxID=332158 RepID=A0ABW3Q8G3_9BACT|nr:hypothetical protein [Larkinella insperata]